MTEQEFRKLEPRKQDAVVAEKVMGLEMRDTYYQSDGEYAGVLMYDALGKCRGCPGEAFRPTTDISAAWEVVEKMNEDGRWFYAMENRHAEIVGGPYWCEFATKAFEEGAQAYAPTAPIAICIAALKAVGEIE